jgi:hypothetical protein
MTRSLLQTLAVVSVVAFASTTFAGDAADKPKATAPAKGAKKSKKPAHGKDAGKAPQGEPAGGASAK